MELALELMPNNSDFSKLFLMDRVKSSQFTGPLSCSFHYANVYLELVIQAVFLDSRYTSLSLCTMVQF